MFIPPSVNCNLGVLHEFCGHTIVAIDLSQTLRRRGILHISLHGRTNNKHVWNHHRTCVWNYILFLEICQMYFLKSTSSREGIWNRSRQLWSWRFGRLLSVRRSVWQDDQDKAFQNKKRSNCPKASKNHSAQKAVSMKTKNSSHQPKSSKTIMKNPHVFLYIFVVITPVKTHLCQSKPVWKNPQTFGETPKAQRDCNWCAWVRKWKIHLAQLFEGIFRWCLESDHHQIFGIWNSPGMMDFLENAFCDRLYILYIYLNISIHFLQYLFCIAFLYWFSIGNLSFRKMVKLNDPG